ncbi:MAG: glycosyl transferase [Alphaproteobacteria bacterium]|nr:MAG: glycosyl transferase [Alphaproteobacteria bacterium]
MTVGFVMLVHTALHRAAEVARHWATAGQPVVIHVDRRVSRPEFDAFRQSLSDLGNVHFSARRRCEWGTWSIVDATQVAATDMLRLFPEVRHVYLASGSCLPLRPVAELVAYLDANPQTDFIESVTVDDVVWTKGGLHHERFTLRFPFAWKRHRLLFDAHVSLQRRMGVKREIPEGIVPHLGSQWWCLTRRTLSAILEDPQRKTYDRYFRRVWIPDESYFQTLARRFSARLESRSLTLSKFDFQGKPYIFYDDHLQLLMRSECFVARKIWPKADRLYSHFLGRGADRRAASEPNPGHVDRVFTKAIDRRNRGRAGLYMQSRFPNNGYENGRTHQPYVVLWGHDELFVDFVSWLSRRTGLRVHGHLFAPERAEFAGGERLYNGCLSDAPKLRDYNPEAFLANLVWNTRGETQCFMMGPDDNQRIMNFMLDDPNARIEVISGAWSVPLFRSNLNFSDVRARAAALQEREVALVERLRNAGCRASANVVDLGEFFDAPVEHLGRVLELVAGSNAGRQIGEAPRLHDLAGLGNFLQMLRNGGMDPHTAGKFADDQLPGKTRRPRMPVLVKR